MNHLLRITLVLIFISFATITFAQSSGSLDSTFGNDGKVYTHTAPDTDSWSGIMAIQNDDKIVALGGADNPYGTIFNLAAIRYNTDGSLDTSFNTTGIALTPVGFAYASITGAVIEPDGKILGLGNVFPFEGSASSSYMILVRYNSNGTLDTTFGDYGAVTNSFNDNGILNSGGLVLQTNGSIVAGAISLVNGYSMTLVCYDSTGKLDVTFGNGGIVYKNIGDTFNAGATGLPDLALEPDGKIVAAGPKGKADSFEVWLTRFNTNGSLDSSFGIDGTASPVFGNYQSVFINGVVLQPDGKIVIAGEIFYPATPSFVVARYDTLGNLDTTFGTEGITASAFNGAANNVTLQSDGKIVAAGYKNLGAWSVNDFEVLRYKTNGTLDSSFGANGEVTTNIIGMDDMANYVAMQKDGKIVVAGGGGDTTTSAFSYFALARYISGLTTGILNLTYSPTNILTYPNPVHNTEMLDYTLTNDETLSINLYDVTGRVMRNYMTNETVLKGEHKQQLNFDNLAAGSYILTISNDEGKAESVKVIKQ